MTRYLLVGALLGLGVAFAVKAKRVWDEALNRYERWVYVAVAVIYAIVALVVALAGPS